MMLSEACEAEVHMSAQSSIREETYTSWERLEEECGGFDNGLGDPARMVWNVEGLSGNRERAQSSTISCSIWKCLAKGMSSSVVSALPVSCLVIVKKLRNDGLKAN